MSVKSRVTVPVGRAGMGALRPLGPLVWRQYTSPRTAPSATYPGVLHEGRRGSGEQGEGPIAAGLARRVSAAATATPAAARTPCAVPTASLGQPRRCGTLGAAARVPRPDALLDRGLGRRAVR